MIDARQRNIALLVASCFFMQNLDGTIVITSTPKISENLHVSSIQVSLVITAYLITCAVFIPLGSWLVSFLGTRKVFLGAIVLFTVSSLLCAASVNLGMLVAMRVLQGCGAALMTPTGRMVALSGVEKHDLLRVLSYIVWPSLVAPVVAPLVGGIITTYASWRWIFLINIPLGLAAYVVGTRLMATTAISTRQRFDTVGFGLTAVGLGGLTYTAHLLSVASPVDLQVVCGVVSIAFIVLAIRHLLRVEHPLVELGVFAIRSFRASNGGITLFIVVVGAIPFLLPLLFQNAFGWSAIRSGACVIFLFLGNLGIKPATTYLLRKFGFRSVLVGSNLCVAASTVVMALFRPSTPIVAIAALLIFSGSARSMGFTAYMSLGYSDVPEPQMRDANVLASTVMQIGAGLAIASGAVALHAGGAIASFARSHPAGIDGYVAAFLLLAVLGAISAVVALQLPRDAGDAVRAPVIPELDLEQA